ncbi:MAG: hypothetical protein ACXAC8_12900 [Candidatus Hodarchaeales archaeon]|jgi:hypothetical protein
MSRKRSRKTLLEISNQPELWIFSNLLAEDWITRKDIKESVFEKKVTVPISLPSGTAIFKLESDGLQGKIISISIAYGSEIHLFQLTDPSDFSKFQEKVLQFVKVIYENNFDFYSYLRSFYAPKMREFGISDILGLGADIKDLANYGVKSRILQHFPDPIKGHEVPQYWHVNQRLVSISSNKTQNLELISSLRLKICDHLAKHAVIEGLRCSIIALKHYADLLDRLSSESQINSSEEHQTLAEGLYELKDFQNAAIFYSKCLSESSSTSEKDRDSLLTALKDCIQQLEPQDFLEYALFAAKIARGHDDDG